jgi:hypothetical protein
MTKRNQELRPLLKESEVAELLNTTAQNLRNSRCTRLGDFGELPFYKLGRAIRYSPADVERWLLQRRRENAIA